jgi:phage terminase small subunit
MTPKQALFIAEYQLDLNATRAAIAAGVPEKSAAVTGSRWLRNPKIAAAIAQRQAQRTAKVGIAAEELDRELARVAFSDAGRLYDVGGKRLPVHLLDEDTRRAIAAVEDETRGGGKRIQRVKLADKLRAIELLYKRSGLLSGESMSAALTAGADGLAAGSEITVKFIRAE